MTETTLSDFQANLSQRLSLEHIDIQGKGLPEGFKLNSTFKAIVKHLEYSWRVQAALALVTGAHGAGKSTAIRYFARQQGVLYWECPPKYQAKHILADLAAQLGISTGHSFRMQTSVVVAQLQSDPKLVILDEAQRMDYDAIDQLKYLADNSGSTFVMVASPSLEQRIERWPDISSRCSVKLRVSAISLEEFILLYGVDGFSTATLKEMHKQTGGIYRKITSLLKHLGEAIQSTPGMTVDSLTPAHIQFVAEQVML